MGRKAKNTKRIKRNIEKGIAVVEMRAKTRVMRVETLQRKLLRRQRRSMKTVSLRRSERSARSTAETRPRRGKLSARNTTGSGMTGTEGGDGHAPGPESGTEIATPGTGPAPGARKTAGRTISGRRK